MKNVSISVLFLLLFSFFAHGQDADQLINKCISSAGPDTKYIKDFRVQLGQSNSQGEYRYKANISLWKDMKYRFTLCCNDGAKSQLILKVQDDANKVVLLSYPLPIEKNRGRYLLNRYLPADIDSLLSGWFRLAG